MSFYKSLIVSRQNMGNDRECIKDIERKEWMRHDFCEMHTFAKWTQNSLETLQRVLWSCLHIQLLFFIFETTAIKHFWCERFGLFIQIRHSKKAYVLLPGKLKECFDSTQLKSVQKSGKLAYANVPLQFWRKVPFIQNCLFWML